MRKHLVLLLLVAAGACGDEEDAQAVPEAVILARRDAASAACVTDELLDIAQENVHTLEGSIPGEDAGIARTAHLAALEFGRAYLQHAQLRASAAAQVDSALNYSPARADSLRFRERAARYAIRVPQPGTVEANVIDQYQREFLAIRSDADHPCNWNFPAEATGG